MQNNTHAIENSFSNDVKQFGEYVYHVNDSFSSHVAVKLQTDQIINTIHEWIPHVKSIIDVGCGDGAATMEFLHAFSHVSFLGFDPSVAAIERAVFSVLNNDRDRISYKVGSIYDIGTVVGRKHYDCAICYGVLHHLTDMKKAASELSIYTDKLIVLEPNGYNPLLKIIEKTSDYHIRHGEKSYWPPTLIRWFTSNGYVLKKRKMLSIVPFFCSEPLAKFLLWLNPIIEEIPVLRELLCGSILLYFEKNS